MNLFLVIIKLVDFILGFTLLYAVPLGYLSGNYAMLIFVFVVILVGTLVGLAMLATAVQPFLERTLVVCRPFSVHRAVAYRVVPSYCY
jgi:hypothetical protein